MSFKAELEEYYSAWLGLNVWITDSLLMFSAVKILRTSRMLQVKVAFLDGNPELLTFLPSSTVQDVRAKAQAVFGQKSLRLVTSNNRVLDDFEQTLEEAEIEDGECLAALLLQPQLAATRRRYLG